MSECSKRLDPIFREFAVNAASKDKAEYGTPEWDACEEKSKELYAEIISIFYRYNPNYKSDKKKQKNGG